MEPTLSVGPMTPAKAADFANSATSLQWTQPANRYSAVGDFRVLAPWCHNYSAIAVFAARAAQRIRPEPEDITVNPQTYVIEPSSTQARRLRSEKFAHRVISSSIDQLHFRDQSVNAIWFEPPTDMDPADTAQYLATIGPSLTIRGNLFMTLTPPQLRACAHYVARHHDSLTLRRLTGDSAPLITLQCVRTTTYCTTTLQDANYNVLRVADDGAHDGEGSSIPELDHIVRPIRPRLNVAKFHKDADPVIRLHDTPAAVMQLANQNGAWRLPEVNDIFELREARQAIQPIEHLPPGHSAIIATNSMTDGTVITDPSGQRNPVIIKGFFNKSRHETFRIHDVVKQADFYDTNIFALDTVTGDISEVGATAAGLVEFMETYGSAIRHRINTLYPPTVDVDSQLYADIGARIDAIPRPLIGKQRHVAIAGAIHLRKNRHLNLFATQGAGKTCTTAGIAIGMRAAVIAVTTPARVVPNWVSEIRAVCPNAIIRIVSNQNPIGAPRPAVCPELDVKPEPTEHCSLEAIRAIVPHATPEHPLWIILKKDSARATYPFRLGLREVWPRGKGQAQPLHLPLAQLVEAERRVNAKPMPGSSPGALAHPKHLMRNADGTLRVFTEYNYSFNSKYDPDQPTLFCPACWEPVHNHPMESSRVSKTKRRQRCPSTITRPVFPKLTQDWKRAVAGLPADDPLRDQPPPERACGFPFTQPMPDRNGHRIYSYGDYFSKRMMHLVDLFVMDESQDYKAKDSLQGTVTRRMAQRAKRTIAVTGTPFGGRISDFFYQLSAFNPQFVRDFAYDEPGRFNAEFGRQETTDTLYVRPNGRSFWRTTKRSIPGFHPKLLSYFWDDTIFMTLDDVDVNGTLPSFTQHARLIEMDDEIQAPSGYSQKSAYAELDDNISQSLSITTGHQLSRQSRQASRAMDRSTHISNYIHEMMTYPENAWMGAAPKVPGTNQTICAMPKLRSDWLYPKEIELLSIVERQRDLGRKCLVYCTHTKLRDVTSRLKSIIQKEGFKVLQLTSAITQEDRAAWLRRQATLNDVIICHPKLVETGINVTEYPTIIWYEIDHSMITTEQASARSYRINQTLPVEVYFLAYAGTMQEHALRLIAQKSDVSRAFRGDLSKTGLSAFNPTDDDIREEIARALLKGEYLNSRDSLSSDDSSKTLERMFSETNIRAGESYFPPEPPSSTSASAATP